MTARATAPAKGGYWLVSSNGTVYAFGGAATYGDMAGKHLNAPIVGIAAVPDGKGYWLVAKDGGVFAFGSARFYNSLPGLHRPGSEPIVGMATASGAAVPGAMDRPGQPGPLELSGPLELRARRDLAAAAPDLKVLPGQRVQLGLKGLWAQPAPWERKGPPALPAQPETGAQGGAGHSERQGRRVCPDDVHRPEPRRGRELSHRHARDRGRRLDHPARQFPAPPSANRASRSGAKQRRRPGKWRPGRQSRVPSGSYSSM